MSHLYEYILKFCLAVLRDLHLVEFKSKAFAKVSNGKSDQLLISTILVKDHWDADFK
jgi:hypothetical protein